MFHAVIFVSMLSLAADPGRAFHEIQADVRGALRQESAAKNFAERAIAVCELARIHREIVGDTRFSESPTLKEYRNQVAIRLLSVQNDLQRQLRRERQKDGERPTVPDADARLLDEQAAALAGSLSLAGSMQGGPVQLATSSGTGSVRGGGLVPDNGQGLVDLIQRTIRPAHWDINGGPGSIVYFAPLRCLVVRASAEAHHEIGGLAGGLRAGGP